MGIIKKTVNFTKKGQVPIDASDQPVYAISKEVQICYPSKFGPEKYLCALVDHLYETHWFAGGPWQFYEREWHGYHISPFKVINRWNLSCCGC